MLQELEDATIRLKFILLKLGLELPPAGIMVTSLLKQIDMDFKQMSRVVIGKHSKLLFENAETVILQTTGTWYPIHNLKELYNACRTACKYIEAY